MNNLKLTKTASIILGVAISFLLLIFGFKILSGSLTRASDYEPRDVVISNIGQNSAKISWSTGIETQGVVEYGTSPTALNFFAPEPQKTKNHLVELTLLSPSTTYYFQIRIGDKKYDNGGVPWTFTTKSIEKTQPSVPSPTPTSAHTLISPTPLQRLKLENTSSQNLPSACEETDCAKIKEKLGKGCSVQDYFRCLRKLTPTSSSTSPTPTASATATLTPTPTTAL